MVDTDCVSVLVVEQGAGVTVGAAALITPVQRRMVGGTGRERGGGGEVSDGRWTCDLLLSDKFHMLNIQVYDLKSGSELW